MFHLYQSNKVEVLLAQLVRLLMQQDVSPLQQQTVVVENPGLAHWLKMQLAKSLGIAANIEFPMPSRFFWQIQRSIQPDLDEESVFSKNTLTWLALECLQDENIINRECFQLLKSYLNTDKQTGRSNQQVALKQYQLAAAIADLYDQYLVYRPDWIENWENNIFEYDGQALGEHLWQGQLWLDLLALAEKKGLSTHHRARQVQDFLTGLKQGSSKSQLPNSVVFFGFSTLPKHQLEALKLLSEHMDVHVLTPNPCQHYWGDVVDETMQARLRMRGKDTQLTYAGNDLLASLGNMGKDYQRLLLEVESIEEHDLFVENENQTLLASIQNHILNLQSGQGHGFALNHEDNSINIVGCHSPMREIEVLHDHLLDVFSSHKKNGSNLNPQDIIVMIPDVASYAPYIDAVFNSAKQGIPYSISDRPIQAEHPLLNGFMHLLELPKGRFTFSDVVSLLEIPAVYQAYGLTETLLPKLKDWLMEAGVRWGFDDQHRQTFALPSWQQNTWLFGFRRLLMGYGVSGEQSIQGISPISNVEGLDAQCLGPLMNFVDDLYDFIQATEQDRLPNEWSRYVHSVLNQFFAPQENEQAILEYIYEALENWLLATQKVSFEKAVDFSLLADGLKQGLQKSGGSQHFMVGKVNFCTLLPMRSIPFKMVAVLGLNDADYPRSVTPNSLDLMRFKHRLGDRSRRDEDRYLFLEAILSARESLWLSYKSRDQKEDKPLTPSVVLAEMMDYLQAMNDQSHHGDILPQLFTQHPLQAFNAEYFSEHSNLFSYNQDWLAANKIQQVDREKAEPPFASIELEQDILLEDFIQFFQSPSKAYLKNVLNINLNVWAQKQSDDEPFNLDGLDQFQLKSSLLERHLRTSLTANTQTSETSMHQNVLSQGQLAYGEIGEKQWHNISSSMQPILDLCDEYGANQASTMTEINIQLASLNHNLLGWLKHVNEQRLLLVVPNRLSAKQVLPLMIQQACLNAMGIRKQAVLICQDFQVILPSWDKAPAREYIKTLVQLYKQGHMQPLAFFPETAWNLVRPNKKGGRGEFNHGKYSMDAFFGTEGMFAKAGEVDDLHVMRCHGNLESIPQATVDLAQQIFGPWVNTQNDANVMEIIAHDA